MRIAHSILTVGPQIGVAEDAMLVEVNPLLVTKSRDVVALDAKVTLDGNALFHRFRGHASPN